MVRMNLKRILECVLVLAVNLAASHNFFVYDLINRTKATSASTCRRTQHTNHSCSNENSQKQLLLSYNKQQIADGQFFENVLVCCPRIKWTGNMFERHYYIRYSRKIYENKKIKVQSYCFKALLPVCIHALCEFKEICHAYGTSSLGAAYSEFLTNWVVFCW